MVERQTGFENGIFLLPAVESHVCCRLGRRPTFLNVLVTIQHSIMNHCMSQLN